MQTCTDKATASTNVDRICEAVRKGDAVGVCSCLGIAQTRSRRGSGDLDKPLLRSPDLRAKELYELLLEQDLLQDKALLVLRALLWIPPFYEMPWQTALAVVASFHRDKRSRISRYLHEERAVWSVLSDISTVLQQAVAPWLIPDNTTGHQATPPVAGICSTITPREMIQQLANILVEPLFVESERNNEMTTSRQQRPDQEQWLLPLEQLLPSLLSICSALQEEDGFHSRQRISTRQYLLNTVFPGESVKGDRLLPWLNLASQIRSHLKEEHYTRLRQVLYQKLTCDKETIIPRDNFGDLMQTVLSFLATPDNDKHNATIPSWQELVLHVLYAASKQGSDTFSQVETVLKSSLSTLSIRILRPWMDAIRMMTLKTTTITPWVHASLQLHLLQAIQQSGSQLVSNLVARALGTSSCTGKQRDDEEDLLKQSWNVLVGLAFSPKKQPRRRTQTQESVLQEAQGLLEHIYYAGHGKIVAPAKSGLDASTAVCLSSHCTKLVHDTIFLGRSRQESSLSLATAERAQLWVGAAQTIVFGRNNHHFRLTCWDVMLSVWIVVTIYVEVPESRTTLVRAMMQCLGDKTSVGKTFKDNNAVRSSLFCTTLSVLVRSISRHSSLTDKELMVEGLRPVADTFSIPLSKRTFCHLATALSPLRFARAALLSACRTKLEAPSFGCWWGDTANQASQENHERITCALYGLCALLIQLPEEESMLDDFAMEARMMLSDIIVLNQKPILSLPARTWLFRHLIKLVQEKRLSEETKQHLLRASLALFLRYCGAHHQTKTPCLFPERAFASWCSSRETTRVSQREDLVSLLRFIMTCSNLGQSNTMIKGRDLLMDMLTSRGKVSCENTVAGFQQLLEEQISGHNSRVLSETIVACCLGAVLQCLLRCSGSLHKSPLHGSTLGSREAESDLYIRVQTMLLEEEKSKYRAEAGGEQENRISNSYKPKWVQSHFSPISTLCSRQRMTRDHVVNPMLSTLCDIIIDTVVDRKWCYSIADSKRVGDLKCVSKSINALVRIKTLFSAGSEERPEDICAIVGFSKETLFETAGAVYEVAAHLLKDLDGLSLNDAEDLFQSVLAYCDSMSALLENSASEALGRRDLPAYVNASKSLRKLYLAIGNDESSKSLICYLEEIIFQDSYTSSDDAPEREDKYQFSLLSMKSAKDVDEAVRHVRLLITSTMLHLLAALSEQAQSEMSAQRDDGSVSPSIRAMDNLVVYDSDQKIPGPSNQEIVHESHGQFRLAPENFAQETISGLPLSHWIDCLRTFSMDLKMGLTGDSGGITPRMFSTYLDLIEGCTDTLLSDVRDPEKFTEQKSQYIWDVGREAGLLLWQIVCTVPLKLSKVFKKTLMLPLHSLSSLYRCLVRAGLSRLELRTGDTLEEFGNFPVIVFEQCINVLVRWNELGSDASWLEVAGADHVSEMQKDKDETQVEQLSKSSNEDALGFPGTGQRLQPQVPSMIEVPANQQESTRNCDGATDAVGGGKLRLHSTKAWSWAFCCSLLSMEKNWEESGQLMQVTTVSHNASRNEPHAPSIPSNEDTVRFTQYSSAREKELSEIIMCVCTVLECERDDNPTMVSKNGEDPPRTNKKSEETFAVMAMKLSSDMKLRLCSLLEKISVVLARSVRNLAAHAKNPSRPRVCGDVAVIESLTCLSAWICLEAKVIDFTSGARRWYHAEKEKIKSARKSSEGAYAPSEPVLARLPKVVSLVGELEVSLQKLDRVLRKHPGNSIDDLEDFVYSVHGDSEVEDETNSLLSRMISRKLSRPGSSSAQEEFGVAFIDSSAESDNDKKRKKRKRSKRNATIEKHMRKARRRRVVRSRNRVIDEMLQRDRESGRDPGNDDDDAFLDLEDFLVEG